MIPVGDINWIGADDYYARIHIGSKSHLLRESLASLEKSLDPCRFVRVHRSAIVQIDRVRELRAGRGGDEVVLRDGSRIRVSRRKRPRWTSSCMIVAGGIRKNLPYRPISASRSDPSQTQSPSGLLNREPVAQSSDAPVGSRICMSTDDL